MNADPEGLIVGGVEGVQLIVEDEQLLAVGGEDPRGQVLLGVVGWDAGALIMAGPGPPVGVVLGGPAGRHPRPRRLLLQCHLHKLRQPLDCPVLRPGTGNMCHSHAVERSGFLVVHSKIICYATCTSEQQNLSMEKQDGMPIMPDRRISCQLRSRQPV